MNNGNEVPRVEMHEGPDPGLGVTDPCPYCGERHVHGDDGEPMSHRAAHCDDKDIPGRGLGYYLLKPLRGLLGLPLKWWEREDAGSGELGFGEPGDRVPEGLIPVPSDDGEDR